MFAPSVTAVSWTLLQSQAAPRAVQGSSLRSRPGSQQPGFCEFLFLRQNGGNLPWLTILLIFLMCLNPQGRGRFSGLYSSSSTLGLLSAEMNQIITEVNSSDSNFLFRFNPYTNHPAMSVQFTVRWFMWQIWFPQDTFPPDFVCKYVILF